MRKPFAPKYNPEAEEWFYDGKYYDKDPERRYQADLDVWAEDYGDDDR